MTAGGLGSIVIFRYIANEAWTREGPDGAWSTGDAKAGKVAWDTCFAILFRRRATRPLIAAASEDRLRKYGLRGREITGNGRQTCAFQSLRAGAVVPPVLE